MTYWKGQEKLRQRESSEEKVEKYAGENAARQSPPIFPPGEPQQKANPKSRNQNQKAVATDKNLKKSSFEAYLLEQSQN